MAVQLMSDSKVVWLTVDGNTYGCTDGIMVNDNMVDGIMVEGSMVDDSTVDDNMVDGIIIDGIWLMAYG